MGEIEVTHYCSCGARFKMTLPADDRLYLKGQRLIKAFTDIHQGEGHRPVNAKECAKVRRRLESQRRAESLRG